MAKFLITAQAAVVKHIEAESPAAAKETAEHQLLHEDLDGWDLTTDFSVTEWSFGDAEGAFHETDG